VAVGDLRDLEPAASQEAMVHAAARYRGAAPMGRGPGKVRHAATYDAAVLVDIRGSDLPGRRVGEHGNVHVGVQRKRSRRDVGKAAPVVELVPGDAARARWEIVVDVTDEGDVRGPFVEGRRGARFVYLSWNDVADDGTLTML